MKCKFLLKNNDQKYKYNLPNICCNIDLLLIDRIEFAFLTYLLNEEHEYMNFLQGMFIKQRVYFCYTNLFSISLGIYRWRTTCHYSSRYNGKCMDTRGIYSIFL